MSASSTAQAPGGGFARAPPPAPTVRVHAVDATLADRRVWLVRVPEVVAELVASAAARDRVLARFTLVGEGAGEGAGDGAPCVEVRLVFPASARKVLVLFAAERAARSALVRSVDRVTRAVVARPRLAAPPGQGPPRERTCVMTEGVNLRHVWGLACELDREEAARARAQGRAAPGPALDLRRLATNCIHSTLRAYGVEAARATVVRELRAVFDAYGIGVDARHLFLIADYMTQDGECAARARARARERESGSGLARARTCAHTLGAR